MSANFVQVSSVQGRTQTLAVGAGVQTFQFRPQSLRGTLAGGDYVYADRIKFRFTGTWANSTATTLAPNWQQMAQIFGQVRIYSPFLGELLNKSLNSVPLIANHDAYFHNGYKVSIRKRGSVSVLTSTSGGWEYEFDIRFGRKYLIRSTDSCPWLSFFEGGEFDVDLNPSTQFSGFKSGIFTLTGNVTAECVIDWFPDKQAFIHTPIASRLYRTVTSGPEFILKNVGAPNGLDGVVPGVRLAILSWLAQGVGTMTSTGGDNGFYAAFGGAGGGLLFGSNRVVRMDIPWRDQVSIDATSEWVSSFLNDAGGFGRYRANIDAGETQNDLAGFPYLEDASQSLGLQDLRADQLDFWPLIWPDGEGAKISDTQKVNGDLSFTATLDSPPDASILNLFRTDEVCAFSQAKVLDLMERMGLPHVSRGGAYDFVPKYADRAKASETTTYGMPLKIVRTK